MIQDEHLSNIHKKAIIVNSVRNVMENLSLSILSMPMMISARVHLDLKFKI